jgi:hypothetical protein
MAPLGEHFPAELLRPRIEAALKPGCVIRLLVKFPQVTKQKYLVLVADDDSEINPFISNRHHLLQCQVFIDAANHNFLDHDSHIACNEVLPMKREEVIKSLMALPTAIKGTVSSDVRNQIVAAVKFAKTIDKDKKNRIIAALEGN